VFDNPELIVACVVGDGEAETGPLATAWHSNQVLDCGTTRWLAADPAPQRIQDRHPTILARITREELEQLFRGYGWNAHFVEGHEPGRMHQAMAAALDPGGWKQIRRIQQDARSPRQPRATALADDRPTVHPRDWTGPEERRWPASRRHLSFAPGSNLRSGQLIPNTSGCGGLAEELPAEELFDEQGHLRPDWPSSRPRANDRMGAIPRQRRQPSPRPADAGFPRLRGRCCVAGGRRGIGDTHVFGRFLRDVAKLNAEQRNFRVFGPDETLLNGLEALFEATPRQWHAATEPNDEFLGALGARDGDAQRAPMPGWLEATCSPGGMDSSTATSVHPHRRLDVQPARQVPQDFVAAAVAAEDRLV